MAFAVAGTAGAESVEHAPPGSVNLYRDRFGTPHLYASRTEDGYFGLGYALAEDRLNGVLLFYRMLAGTLAEGFGPGPLGSKAGVTGAGVDAIVDTVASDREALRWRYLADARANFVRLEPQQRANMTAFMQGIEAFMRDHPDRVPRWAPKLEPALATAGEGFLMIAAGGLPRGCETSTADSAKPGNGSNIWAVAAQRTTDRAAAFSSDSHGETELFGTMLYPARISAGPVDAWTLDIAGLPIALKGHSRYHAWGWSEGPRFPADCLKVPVAGRMARSYRIDGQVRPLIVVPYRIKVRGGADRRGTFEYTRHNEILSPVVRRESQSLFVVSHAYAGREGRAGEQFAAMVRATDREQMDAALQRREIYPANLIIAGADGRIRFIRPGRLPRRSVDADPGAVVDAGRPGWAWQGYRGFKELLKIDDPVAGFLANDNASPDMMFAAPLLDPNRYPRDFAFEPGQTGTRQRRSIALLEQPRTFTFGDLSAVVGDACIPETRLWNAAFRNASELRQPADAAFTSLLVGFNGCFVAESRGALAHALWRIAMREKGVPAVLPIDRAVMAGIKLSDAQARLLVEAADVASARLQKDYGAKAVFGDVFRYGRGSGTAPGRGLTLLPMARDGLENGDFGSLWAATYARSTDGRYRHNGETRAPFLVQFTHPIRSYSLAIPGVSDDPRSPHYNDQVGLVASGSLHSNFFESDELAANVESVRRLRRSGR